MFDNIDVDSDQVNTPTPRDTIIGEDDGEGVQIDYVHTINDSSNDTHTSRRSIDHLQHTTSISTKTTRKITCKARSETITNN